MKGAAAAALLLLNLVLALRVGLADAPRLRGALDVYPIEIGEALRLAQHPRSIDPAARMPIGTLTEAAFSRLSPAALSAWALLLYAATALLVYALARDLGGDWAALAAAAAWQNIFLGLPFGAGSLKQFWLTGLGLLAAVALVRHARRPRNVTAAAVGLGFGLAGLTRSTYILLPPILAAGEASREGSSRRRLARGALILIFFALPLAPWTAMNASVKRRFQPVEYGAGDLSIVSGALGAVHGTEGDHIAWMGSPESDRGKSVLGWAVLTVLRHPAPYLRGVASRVAYVLGLKPWLFALAALGFFLARRDAGARALALQCAYFLALLCAMPVEASYFEPVWPLLMALAGAPLARLDPPPAARAGAAAAAAGVALASLLALLIAADSGFRALSYAVKYSRRLPWSDAALDEALARRPPEAWVSLEDASRRLRKGDAAGAIRVLEESRSVLGDLPRHRMMLEWARAKAGEPGQLLALSAPATPGEIPYNDDLREILPIYQAIALDASGRHAEARKRMSSALEGRRNHQGFSRPAEEPLSAALKPRLIQRAEQSFAGSIEALLAEDAPSDLTRALELANDVDPTFEGRLALARTYAAGDRKREARGALARAEELAREPEQLHLLSFRWAEIGDGARSRRLLETLTRRFPELALYWSDLGVALYRSGDANGAERALRRALTAEPGMPAATLSLAALLSGRGAHDEARFLCASAKLSRLEDDDLRARLQACGAGRSD